MQEPKFVEFKTEDGLFLPGLLYHPQGSKKILISLHGNGSSSVFYDEFESRILASALAKKGISFLAFNNRGAHIIKKINVKKNGEVERKRFGMAYEKIKECILDIDGAVKYLEKQGFNKFFLIGFSTGANKICIYNYFKPKNKFSNYILVGGGDDTGIYYDQLGDTKFYNLLNKSKEKIKKGQGEELITDPKLFPEDILSYIGFWDVANPDGDYNCFPFFEVINKIKLSKKPLFRYFESITKLTLVVNGELDEYAWGDVPRILNILKKHRPKFTYEIIKGADHGCSGKEEKLASVVANWLNLSSS